MKIKNLTKAFFIAFVVLAINVNAQKFTKSVEPYKTVSGKTYHVGDTIIITCPSDFSNTFVYFKSGKKLQMPIHATFTSNIVEKNQIVDRRYTRYVIKQFRDYGNLGMYAVLDKMFGYAVNIDQGLEMGEVANEKLIELYDKPELFNNEKAFLLTLGTEIDNNDVKEYLYRFNHDEYKQNYQNEFSFNSILSSKKSELIEKAKQYNINKPFFAYVKQKFGSYNFDTKSFPIIWDGNYIRLMDDQLESSISKDINNDGIDFSDIRLYFENMDQFSSFSLPQERAKFLIDHRKQPSGKINRSLYVQVQFIVKEVAGTEWMKNKNFTDGTEKVLICEIKRIDMFEDKASVANYLSTVEK